MSLDLELKQQIKKEYSLHEKDSGSTEMQIAMMHARIKHITEHLKKNKKDVHSRMGLINLVGKRRKLEKYLKKNDIAKYRELIKQLGIREVTTR